MSRPDLWALLIMGLLHGLTVPADPAALRAMFRSRLRIAIGAAVTAGLLDDATADEFAAAISEGVTHG